jgi:hypothetical protein
MSSHISENHDLVNPLNAELNPIHHLLALVGAHHIVHVTRVRVNVIQVTALLHNIMHFLELLFESHACGTR